MSQGLNYPFIAHWVLTQISPGVFFVGEIYLQYLMVTRGLDLVFIGKSNAVVFRSRLLFVTCAIVHTTFDSVYVCTNEQKNGKLLACVSSLNKSLVLFTNGVKTIHTIRSIIRQLRTNFIINISNLIK